MKLLLALGLVLPTLASARPSAWLLTCRDATEVVRSHGAVVMNYDYKEDAGYLYKLFVVSGYYCDRDERTQAAYVRTSDSDSCNIGFVCKRRNNK